MGESALLVELPDLHRVLALASRLRDWAVRDSGIEEVVPAARTVLVVARGAADLGRLGAAIEAELDALPAPDAPGRGVAPGGAAGPVVEIPVRYDGADLAEVAALTGLSAAEVVAAHTGTPWRVAFGGFAPGFGYLVGGDPRLVVPRRERPRTRVPAGSVGLAGEFSGMYPTASPGGWQLIGTTDVTLWDPLRDPPALLRPGVSVQFVRVGSRAARPGTRTLDAGSGVADAGRPVSTAGSRAGSGASAPEPAVGGSGLPGAALQVLATGPLVLVEDAGRPGYAAVGVGRSGAADRAAHALGARLVGQPEDRAALELTLGGLRVRARGDLTAALTGAPAAATLDGRPVPHAAPFRVRDGQVLAVPAPRHGLRTYLSVRGGLAVSAVLGSRSSDTLSGTGPPPVRAGDLLPVGPPPHGWPHVDIAPTRAEWEELALLTVLPGPRLDWLSAPDELTGHDWVVDPASDRVGIRLQGRPAQRHTTMLAAELPTEGLLAGAIQVPPGGEPVIFLRDHPVTGGYPVVAVLRAADVDRAAQLRPGEAVRLRWAVSPPRPHTARPRVPGHGESAPAGR